MLLRLLFALMGDRYEHTGVDELLSSSDLMPVGATGSRILSGDETIR